MVRWRLLWSVVALTTAAGGCESPAGLESALPVAFWVEATGSESVVLDGLAFVLPLQPQAYGEGGLDGHSARFDVTPVILTESSPADLSRPMLSLGVLGSLREGRYRVAGAPGVGARDLRFHAEFIVPEAGGLARHYLIDEGELVIRSTRPFLQARLVVQGSRMIRLPVNPEAGASATAVAASIQVEGQIGGA